MANTNSTVEPDPPQRPSRLEAEVAEILARAEQPASFTDHVRRKTEANLRQRPQQVNLPSLDHLGPGSFLLGSLAFAVLGAMLSGFSPLLGTLFGIASVVCLIMVWVRRVPPGINQPKTWRGRDISGGPEPPDWVNNIRDRMRRPPRI
jgi:hypothetical protein